MMDSASNKKIKIAQAESKLALAIEAHLRQILRTVSHPSGGLLSPISMDHAELLLCSASLRALLFDDTPAATLLGFLEQHDIEIEMDCVETDMAMLLLSQVEPLTTGHVSDLFAQIPLTEKGREEYPLDSRKPLLLNGDQCEAYASIEAYPQVWKPPSAKVSSTTFKLEYSQSGEPTQLCHFTRRRVRLNQWGDIPLGLLRELSIRRRNIICYVANKLGGVHYQSTRLPNDAKDKAEFKILTQAYDWQNQAIMHAGLVAVGIACIEIAAHPQIREVLMALHRFNDKRQNRLFEGKPIK